MHSRQAAAGGDADCSPSGGYDAKEEAAALERDIQRIAAKTAAYTKERLDALAVLQQPAGGCAEPEARDEAARALVAQLDVQLERLELARRRKAAELARLGAGRAAGGGGDGGGAAAAVTLGGIIANEGVRA